MTYFFSVWWKSRPELRNAFVWASRVALLQSLNSHWIYHSIATLQGARVETKWNFKSKENFLSKVLAFNRITASERWSKKANGGNGSWTLWQNANLRFARLNQFRSRFNEKRHFQELFAPSRSPERKQISQSKEGKKSSIAFEGIIFLVRSLHWILRKNYPRALKFTRECFIESRAKQQRKHCLGSCFARREMKTSRSGGKHSEKSNKSEKLSNF